jgi:hypothetical protein
MTWAIVGLVFSIAAGRMGPDAGAIYLVVLGVSAVAVLHVIAPNLLRLGGRGERDDEGAR